MKYLVAICFVFSIFKARAYEMTIHPEEAAVKCDASILKTIIPKLASVFSSRADTFSLKNENPSICLAIKEYLSKSERIKIVTKSSMRNQRETIYLSECEDVCSGVYRFYQLEMIEITLNGIPFKEMKEVPGTSRLETYTWDERSCPPHAPDCDL